MDHQLTIADFQQGRQHVAARESELNGSLTPPSACTAGCSIKDCFVQHQHARIEPGCRAHRRDLDRVCRLWSDSRMRIERCAPYEATFIGMSSTERRKWARQLELPSSVRNTLAQPADLIFLLLGDDYLAGCEIDGGVTLGGRAFCSAVATRRSVSRNCPAFARSNWGTAMRSASPAALWG